MNFSVLLSLYHKEKASHLNECLQSIDSQSLKSNEIMIVLDGPVGKELCDVIEQWRATLPIKLFQLTENKGLGIALNKGLELCSNDIILRMDTDDVCTPERFNLQIEKLENDKELVLLGGHIEEFDEELKKSHGKRVVPTDYAAIKKQVAIKNPFNHMTVAFRRSAILAVGGYQHHAFMEDYNLWLRLIAAGYKVENLDMVLVKARTGTSMLLRRKGIDYIKSEISLYKLKRKLQVHTLPVGLCVLILRTVPRIFPALFLQFCYKTQRE
ncbi:glycosyltransferase [Escherichia coli]|uniref:glycosyltransferase n=1 Tax=Escherichia coli TaxID=562 RepID=UPI000F85DEDA|nr:glycosyltransferase [Escherichia coli]EEX0621665.1 glycosyltransferase [Escherichia coli]EFG6863761.1 glycosyltransferase [Escherichia coli]EFG8594292.1 glycosyltransferase [Escherichia coli]EFH5808730.1 glycosyltransferase [Escherichia coli]EFN2499738.1 glycosyltransferase [Escherichia coli]